VPSVLIIDDEPNIRRMVAALLRAEGYDVREASSGADGVLTIADDEPDAALLDLMMPGELDGMATLARIRERWTDLPVVMMSGRASLSDAVRATKLGAVNFLEKPLAPETVLLALSSALELRQSRRTTRELREALSAALGRTGEMIGSSAPMARVRDIIERVAPSDARILIGGESGTGKELVAEAIHARSDRRDRPFIRVNCAAIPRDLVESEMFGHEKGSFTGATATRVGKFEAAHTGTLFLDEVGDLNVEAQAKLLRAIEAKEIQRVGGNRTIRADVRVIAATNKDLARAVADGSFREDLFFRLNVIPITLPPLRERGNDVIELTHHFSAQQHARTGRPLLQWSDDALVAIRAYRWPGNVRELANIIERVAILNTGACVRAADVRAMLPTPTENENGTNVLTAELARNDVGLVDALDAAERSLITDALARADGNVAEAARQLRTDRPNLYRRMKRLGITGAGLLLALAAGGPFSGVARAFPLPNTMGQRADSSRDSTRRPPVVEIDSAVLNPDSGDTHMSNTRATVRAGISLSSGKTYNRVEGLPIMLGPTLRIEHPLAGLQASAYGIVRTGRDWEAMGPNAGHDLSVDARLGTDRRIGIGARAYNIVSPIEPWQMSEPEHGLAAVLLRRDYLDYYNRHGGALSAAWFINSRATLTLGYADERWTSRDARNVFTILRGGTRWRDNPPSDEGRVHLFTVDTRYDTRNDELRPEVGWYLTGQYERGTSDAFTRVSRMPLLPAPAIEPLDYQRLFFDLRRYNRLSPRTRLNARLVAGGWVGGDPLPNERALSIGGPGTLPGYDFRHPVGSADVQLCTTGGPVTANAPAQCDRVLLGQLEFRTDLANAPFDVANSPRFRLRSAGFTAKPAGVIFADVGRGWRTTTRWSSRAKADIGAGIDLGLLGVYIAKALSDRGEPINVVVRVRRRF
jgi:two-component system nitrogen regulation response regulator NtrX